ncbi:hypothetical protein [Pararobbsia silviterrae]|uniref:SpaO FliM/N C-terminal related domain-containing protein n=1 Tax=Pararobbsia silviterrae TaxID=1792498 RepID=A0A494XKS7_9BURK|nr:hypothetical protein [Pararobbsia silviterrae]RKP50342.1 hypothetical protein D7S86_19760 [Pararobbsia silviterrae]
MSALDSLDDSPVSGIRRVLMCVPARDPLALRSAYLVKRLRLAGIDAVEERTDAVRRSIVATVTLDTLRIEVGVEASHWCAWCLEGGERLAFDAMHASYLLATFERHMNARPTMLGRFGLRAWRAKAIESVPRTRSRVVLQTSDGLALAWMGPTHEVVEWCGIQGSVSSDARVDGIAVDVALRIGRSAMTYATCARIARGDVLLIQSVESCVVAVGHAWGEFEINEGTWMMYPFDEVRESAGPAQTGFGESHGARDSRAPDGASIGASVGAGIGVNCLDAIRVEFEFVLDRRRMTIGDLRTVEAGATFALTPGVSWRDAPDDTHGCDARRYCVQLCVNGQVIGEGELVALGETLAVQVTRMVNVSGELGACQTDSN